MGVEYILTYNIGSQRMNANMNSYINPPEFNSKTKPYD